MNIPLLVCLFLALVASSNASSRPLANRALKTKGEHKHVHPRIVGGTEATTGQFPFMVLLVAEDVSSGVYITPCGGSLIAPDTVLSAAHCFDSSIFTYQGVVIGDLTPFDFSNSGHYIPLAETPILHPQYNPDTSENDLMVLKLDGSSSFKPVELVFEDSAFDSFMNEGTAVTVAGWGAIQSGGRASNRLLSTDLVISSYADCSSLYGTIPQDKMICAGHAPGGKDSCQGDSGGPLFHDNGTHFVQIGIVSFGYSCALPETPGVYTRVANYESFIRSNAGDLDANPPASATGTASNPLLRAPLDWICPPFFYDANPDGFCECGCGVTDPDCSNPLADLFCNGLVAEVSNIFRCSQNQCERRGDSQKLPLNWQCDSSYYDADDGCDCDCGDVDPDCLKSGQELFNCEAGDVCFEGLCYTTFHQQFIPSSASRHSIFFTSFFLLFLMGKQ